MSYFQRYPFSLTVISNFLLIIAFVALSSIHSVVDHRDSGSKKQMQAVMAHHTDDDTDSFYTDISVNGVAIGSAVIDTGASDTTISIDLAKKAQIDYRKGHRQSYQLADGSKDLCWVTTAMIGAGRVVREAPLSVCRSGDSLLGMSFMTQTILHLEKDSMTFK